MGALRAIKAGHRDGTLLVAAFDGIPEFVDLLKKGDIVASGMQQPYLMGVKSGEALISAIKGEHAGEANPGADRRRHQQEHRPDPADHQGDRVRQRNEVTKMEAGASAPASLPTETMTDPATPLLEARAISKSFAQTRALVGANLTLRPGVTHALLGANGAGKSTLSRVISGHVRRDGGEILYRGEPRDVRSPREALDAGIAMVMQETSLAPDLSVLENIFLPDLGRPGSLSRPTMRRRASEILADLGQEHAVSLDAEARDLSAAQRQLVEIAKALALKANLIIFDEPTASLSPSEVERLFDVIARLESAQCAIVFVSHRLEEVFAISDEITVMREGRTVAASRPTSSLNQTELVRLMVGRDLGSIYAASSAHRRHARRAGAVRSRASRAPDGARHLIRLASRRDPGARRPGRRRALRDGRDALRPASPRRRRSAL